MELDNLRKKIDEIDGKILDLLNVRAKIAKSVGTLKARTGQDYYIPHREKKVIAALLAKNRGPLPPEAVEAIYREVINACRSLESRLKVSYFGPEASFTHQAAIRNFGSAAQYLPVKSIGDVFTEVEKGRADYGVVPIENSTEGVVNHTLDMFIESDLVICAEISMEIEHYLLSRTGKKKDIRKIYSHPQALAQCQKWLEENFPGVAIEEKSSTSVAAKSAVREKHAAAVASKSAAGLYGLEVVARGIEDSRENYTRFLVIGKKPAEISGQDKTSIMFSIKDRVGALHDILNSFKHTGVNMTKIESRPTKKKAWEYIFFVDFLGHASEKRVQKALAALSRHCVFLKILGSYPKAD